MSLKVFLPISVLALAPSPSGPDTDPAGEAPHYDATAAPTSEHF